MHALVATAAIAALLLTASDAEARARFKFGSSKSSSSAKPAPRPAVAPAAAPSGTVGGVIVPAALLGGSIAARASRSREDLPTGSMNPVSPVPASSTATTVPGAKPATKPAFVCATDRSVGVGAGFCQLN